MNVIVNNNMTPPSEFTRNITAPDAPGVATPQYSCSWSTGFRLGAICDTANAIMSARIYLLNSISQPISVIPVTFQCQNIPDFGTLFVGIADGESWWPLAGAKQIMIKVDSISGGNWTLNGAMSFST